MPPTHFTPKPLHDQLVRNVLLLGAELAGEAPDEPPLELVDAYSRAVRALCAYFDSNLAKPTDRNFIRDRLKKTTATA